MKRLFTGIGITAGILAIIGGIAYYWMAGRSPRETVKAEGGAKVHVEELSFYQGDTKGTDKVFRPVQDSSARLSAVIYCQSREYGESWCRALAGKGIIGYCFDFSGDTAAARAETLRTVLGGMREQRHVAKDRIFVMGEGLGCLPAAELAVDKPKQVRGLILVSPGFNPLEISRKARRYRHSVLVVDDSLGRAANVEEVVGFILQ